MREGAVMEISVDPSLAGNLVDVVYSGEFEAYTPYLGGDFKARTFEHVGSEDGQIVFTGYPTAKAILGRMRWTTRLLVGSFISARDYREAEYNARIKGTQIPLVPFLYGVTSAHLQWAGQTRQRRESLLGGLPDHWAGVARLQVRLLETSRSDEDVSRLRANRYSALLRRGRDDQELLKPAQPGFRISLTLSLDARRAQRRLGNHAWNRVRSPLHRLLAHSLILSLSVFGVGKATNRGFGRFKPLLDDSMVMPREVLQVTRSLYNAGSPQEVKDRLKELFVNALATLREVVEGVNVVNADHGNRGSITRLSPLLDVEEVVRDVVTAGRPRLREVCYGVAGHLRRVNGVTRAIEAIGLASTKAAWKACVAGYPLDTPGLNMHTWPLGLPRHQKFPSRCNCGGRERSSRGLKLQTGYLVGDKGVLGNSSVVCEDQCCRSGEIAWSRAGFREVRRQSMIIAYPHPAPRGGDPFIVVLFLPSWDLAKFLDYGNESLYHLGPHNVRSSNKPCSEPAIRIAYALSRTDSIQGKRAGVMRPARGGEGVEIERVNDPSGQGYMVVLDAAVEMFLAALRAIY